MTKPIDGDDIVKFRASKAEKELLRTVAGGDKAVSNLIRRAIREELKKRNAELPDDFFLERPAGNSTKGANRRGNENALVIAS